jgi:hypothetical protein
LSVSAWSGLKSFGALSQTSPLPSLSVSSWFVFAFHGQLSTLFWTVSLS